MASLRLCVSDSESDSDDCQSRSTVPVVYGAAAGEPARADNLLLHRTLCIEEDTASAPMIVPSQCPETQALQPTNFKSPARARLGRSRRGSLSMYEHLLLVWYYGRKAGTNMVFMLMISFTSSLIVCNFLHPWINHRRIRYDKAKIDVFSSPQIRTELFKGVFTAVGGFFVMLASEYAEAQGWMQLKKNSKASTIMFEFSIYFVFFDLYYYALHRFLLHGKYGWWIHSVHHTSIISNPATGFSFHAIEGIITGGFNPLLGALLSFDRKTLFVAQLYGLFNTVFVHLGYELVPMWWNKSPFTKWYLSSQFHDVHHQKINCNYGGFTTICDRMFGTVHRDFDLMVTKLAKRANAGPGALIRD